MQTLQIIVVILYLLLPFAFLYPQQEECSLPLWGYVLLRELVAPALHLLKLTSGWFPGLGWHAFLPLVVGDM